MQQEVFAPDDRTRMVSRHSLAYILCAISELFRHYDFDPLDLLIIHAVLNGNVINVMRDEALDRQFAGLDAVEPDDIIHQPLRLRIMAALNALPAANGLEFAKLKKLTGATDGNLGAHIETLAKAGYVAVEKAFVGKKPQTTVTATTAGRTAFARHVNMLKQIIDAASDSGGSREPS